MTIDLDFGSMSDDEFEQHLNGDTRAEIEGDAERDELNHLEERAEKLRKERKHGSQAPNHVFGKSLGLTEQLLKLDEDAQAAVMRAANFDENGVPTFTQYSDVEELAEALSPKYRDEFNHKQERRIKQAIAASKGVKQDKPKYRNAMDLSDEEFERAEMELRG